MHHRVYPDGNTAGSSTTNNPRETNHSKKHKYTPKSIPANPIPA